MSESKKNSGKSKLPLKIRVRSVYSGFKKHFKLKISKIKQFIKGGDFQSFKNSVLRILLNGLFITISISYFTGFRLVLIPITGCAWYILKKELFPEIRQIISSFNLIRIVK